MAFFPPSLDRAADLPFTLPCLPGTFSPRGFQTRILFADRPNRLLALPFPPSTLIAQQIPDSSLSCPHRYAYSILFNLTTLNPNFPVIPALLIAHPFPPFHRYEAPRNGCAPSTLSRQPARDCTADPAFFLSPFFFVRDSPHWSRRDRYCAPRPLLRRSWRRLSPRPDPRKDQSESCSDLPPSPR